MFMNEKRRPFLIFLCVVGLAAWPWDLAPGQFANPIVPNNLANTEGNSAADLPVDGFLGSMRYQQVYAASQFFDIRNEGGFIDYIAFRLDGGCGGAQGQSAASLQIDLSTTVKGPDSLSPVFAQNVGLDDTVVRGPSTFTILLGCGSTPEPFELIVLDRPFFYNPNAGNLLLDIRNYSGPNQASGLALDAQNMPGDSISRIVAFNVNAATADVVDSKGFVTLFGIQPVPEPSTWALLGLGLGGLALSRIRRNSKRGQNAAHGCPAPRSLPVSHMGGAAQRPSGWHRHSQ